MDFVHTMKDWRRMCQHMEKIGGDRSCEICRLGGCNAIYEDDGSTDYANVEEKVATWAAENPEPQYPTWAEWLLKVGAARRVPIGEPWPVELPDGSMLEPCYEIVVKENERIPAYIAEPLGIEPKEGWHG